MDKKQLQDLQSKLESNEMQPEERRELYRRYNAYLKANALDDFDEDIAAAKMQEFDLNQVFAKKKNNIKKFWRWSAGVAAVGLIFVLAYYTVGQRISPEGEDATSQAIVTTIAPSIRNEAIAILPNGKQLVLNRSGFNTLEQGYGSLGDQVPNQFITLKTPRGARLNFILPDGSQVWLNAETSLTYPLAFGKDSRQVSLVGEAFFEVVKQRVDNKQVPFIVDAGTQQVKVLGTKFNVNNYSNEAATATTLVEGSVEVKGKHGLSRLVPDQQFIQRNEQSKIVQVDVQDYVGWKDGLIKLDKQDFPAIARAIERNFDVKFEANEMPEGFALNGELLTNVNIDELLNGLGAAMQVKFTRKGKQISISKIN
jgi:hypothetical protein